MKWKLAIAAVLVILVGLVAVDGVFIVKPDQFAIVTEFGDPVNVIVEEVCADLGENRSKQMDDIAEGVCKETTMRPKPGLYFKMPLTQDVRFIDARVQGWYDDARDTKTVELRTIDFKAFARWRVIDPLRFYTAARTVDRVMAGMDSIVTARIQSVIREHKLASIVRDRGRKFVERAELDLRELITEHKECRPEDNDAIQKVLKEAEEATKGRDRRGADDVPALRSEIVDGIRIAATEQLEKEFGITILDLHFMELNYSQSIYPAMVEAIAKDRERDIASYRKIGQVCRGSIDQAKLRLKGEIDGEKDKEVRRILGDAQAEAIRIKREAFGTDPDFFRFIKTLEVYENSLGGKTSLVLSTSSPLFALMNDKTLMESVAPSSGPPPTFAPRRALPGMQPNEAPTPTPTPRPSPTPEATPTPTPSPTPAPTPTPTPDPAPTTP
ncbi:MAG: hypothetical protein CVU56_03880 [Deltaproteobacteria bacterium HGW-Deltaproteobacteria-14]|nr:MAG: hypothetical protein CVU56_03880 [Deltaproteobacteria bacterium HGW-Deltaproteobacteria-14]